MSPEWNRHGLHILVAEDSPTQAELLRQALIDKGYKVTVAGNGLAALEAARHMPPALVITDVVMPDMDGYQLCRAIKADAALRETPVMIVTALRKIDDIVMALESGADNFIRKPFDSKALLARIDYLLVNRKLRTHSKLHFGIDISLGGKKHLITAAREQILDLLFSSYEEALLANEELRERQGEVQSLNLKLAARAVELEDANKQLRSFSHTVSHDLRSPLATICGFSSILQSKYATGLDPKAIRYLASIEQEALRMRRIVDDVLYLANIDRAHISLVEMDIAPLAQEVVETLRDSNPERCVKFDCAGQAVMQCDARLMRIALENLLGNAWKFTSKLPEGRITFGVQDEGGERVFFVKDNGAGFDMAYAHRLFKPFERLHGSDEFEGFGIGLATVQRIVALHGGRIWASSAPEQGADFRFTLEPPATPQRA